MVLTDQFKSRLLVLYYFLFVFTCCADLFFAVRIHDYNFRLAQLLLLFGTLPTLCALLKQPSLFFHSKLKTILNWVPFIVLYTVSAFLSADRSATFLKLAWTIFNIGGTAILLLGTHHWEELKKGFVYGIGAVAVLLWIQTLMIYPFGMADWFNTSSYSSIHDVPWQRSFLGFAQYSWFYEGQSIYRPNAFFYEPSYAGCAITLAFPLCLLMMIKSKNITKSSIAFCAILLGALFLTTSRAAILGITVGSAIALLASLAAKRQEIWKSLLKIFLTLALLFGLLGLAPNISKYADFFMLISSPHPMAQRLGEKTSSEGWRIENTKRSLDLIKKHPIFGNGVPPLSADRGVHGLGLTSEDTWLEIAIESGILGFIAFIFAIGRTLWDSLKKADLRVVILVTAALAPHYLVTLNFSGTFPRLDFWMAFYIAVRLGFESSNPNPERTVKV